MPKEKLRKGATHHHPNLLLLIFWNKSVSVISHIYTAYRMLQLYLRYIRARVRDAVICLHFIQIIRADVPLFSEVWTFRLYIIVLIFSRKGKKWWVTEARRKQMELNALTNIPHVAFNKRIQRQTWMQLFACKATSLECSAGPMEPNALGNIQQ